VNTFARAMALAASVPAAVLACGVCIEDRIAATYDHGVVQQAARDGRAVVYCALDGGFDVGHLKRAARALPGVDARSVRVSTQPGALSFVVDTARQTPDGVVQKLRAALPRGAQVKLLRVMSAPAATR
jgi:hypothetical protein